MTFLLFKRGLMAGAALSVLATGAQATDDLAALKAQLEALQSQVDSLEARPKAPVVPDGASLLTVQRGSGSMAAWQVYERPSEVVAPDDRGFTIAITPSADLPAPVHEITISGYVKVDAIFDFNQDLGDFFDTARIDDSLQNKRTVRLHARQSRLRIRSRSDTAVGQVRTLIEGDFFGGSQTFRMRHAWGEWDMTPNFTLGAGQSSRVFLDIWAIPTVDFEGPAGVVSSTRAPQVRLKYTAGPSEFAVAVLDPRNRIDFPGFEPDDRANKAPDVEAHWQYNFAGGHQVRVAGTLVPLFTDSISAPGSRNRDELGWGIMGGGNFHVTESVALTGGVIYADGYSNLIAQPTGAFIDAGNDIRTIEVLGLNAGTQLTVTETTTVNVGWGWTRLDSSDVNAWARRDAGTQRLKEAMTVHGNVMWQPVRQLQLGWEIMYGRNKLREADDGGEIATATNDAWRGQFGAWFFF